MRQIEQDTREDSETAIMNAKYGFVHGALQEAGYEPGDENSAYRVTHIVDKILASKYVGFPIFLLILLLMFEVTFVLGQFPMDWIDAGVTWLGEWVSSTMPDGPLKAMLVDGVIGGVGSVIVFLPQILILYWCISFMEDSGYMARAAFIMDKLMHKMGLHGKSFIPLIMGFGCELVRENVRFLPTEDCLVAFVIKGTNVGDSWHDIVVVLNANKEPRKVAVEPRKYTVVCRNQKIDERGLDTVQGSWVEVPGQSALIMHD